MLYSGDAITMLVHGPWVWLTQPPDVDSDHDARSHGFFLHSIVNTLAPTHLLGFKTHQHQQRAGDAKDVQLYDVSAQGLGCNSLWVV